MKAVLGGVMVLATLAVAGAGQRYDVKLEQAVMNIVASRIGDIRPGLDFRQEGVKPSRPKQAVAVVAQGAAWRVVAPMRTVSRTVGSIQIFTNVALDPAADAHRAYGYTRRKLPHVFKF